MKITEYVFDNGLKLIYQKRPDPLTAVSIQCCVGSVNEPTNLNGNINLNGISHMIEHMMFKGTTNIRDTKGIAKIFDSIGAYFNAYTDKNITSYTVKSSSEHIEIIIKTLADMLMNSLFLKKEFELEKNVVNEEIIRAIDNTAGHLNSEIYSLYFEGNNLENSVGKLHTFNGNYGVLLRAYVYILSLGKEGLRDLSRKAVLNANYLKHLLMKKYDVPFNNGTMHEFVISAEKQKQKSFKALDIAKNLLDYGIHPPTVYFPTNIAEAIMIEPTETETKETLDDFARIMNYLDENIDTKLDYFKDAPYETPVRRLNEAKANRELDVKWKNEI